MVFCYFQLYINHSIICFINQWRKIQCLCSFRQLNVFVVLYEAKLLCVPPSWVHSVLASRLRGKCQLWGKKSVFWLLCCYFCLRIEGSFNSIKLIRADVTCMGNVSRKKPSRLTEMVYSLKYVRNGLYFRDKYY